MQDLLNHTTNRLAQSISEVLLLYVEEISEVTLHTKWGIDGTSGFTSFKQRFQNTSSKDENMLVTCMVPIRLVIKTTSQANFVCWQNPRTSSPRFCRPIRLQYTHETTDLTNEEVNRVEQEIINISPTIVDLGTKTISVSHALYFTMTDGKICNAVTGTSSTQRCYICKLTSSKFNSIAASCQEPVDVESSFRAIYSSFVDTNIRMFVTY